MDVIRRFWHSKTVVWRIPLQGEERYSPQSDLEWQESVEPFSHLGRVPPLLARTFFMEIGGIENHFPRSTLSLEMLCGAIWVAHDGTRRRQSLREDRHSMSGWNTKTSWLSRESKQCRRVGLSASGFCNRISYWWTMHVLQRYCLCWK